MEWLPFHFVYILFVFVKYSFMCHGGISACLNDFIMQNNGFLCFCDSGVLFARF